MRLCPGRHFAKQEMISGAAIFLSAFDIQLRVPDGFKSEVDRSYFAFGTMPPKGVIPAKIRRRKFCGGGLVWMGVLKLLIQTILGV